MPSDNMPNNLGESLIESVGAAGLTEIALEASDIALDLALNDGLLKDIPVFGWLAKGYSAYRNIADRLFLKKVALFLSGVGKASASEREKFKSELNRDPEFRKRVGENLLLLINRHERLEKSYLLGKLMTKVIEGACSYEFFLRIAAAIDHSTVEDLEDLRTHAKDVKGLPDSVQQSLYKSHLLDMDIHANSLFDDSMVSVSVTYKLNALGEKLIEYALLDDA